MEATKKAPDNLIPAEEKWAFDASVTAVFEAMLENSIPGYEEMRSLVTRLGRKHLQHVEGGVVIDIGASRGDAIADLVKTRPDNNFYAVEISEPMRDVLKSRFENEPVTICDHDLRTNHSVFGVKSDLILSVLTLMFIPIEHRQALVQSMYDSLKPGGMLILVEKTLAVDPLLNTLTTDMYYEFKAANGYTQEAISRKKLSLEGVLVPLTEEWTTNMLRMAGFYHTQCFWRNLNFCGTIAVKG